MHKDIYAKQEGVPPFKFRIMQSMMNLQTKRVALKRLEILNGMDHPEGEYHKLRKWMDKICDVPFGKTIPMPVTKESSRENIHAFLEKTKESINAKVYGHQEAKDMIVRIMAQWISNPFSKGNVIGIHGNPGVGKTTLIKDGVCEAIGLPFSFIPLGGSNDASYLDGHSYTYEGSSNGKIIDSLIQAGCDNPVLYFDELDKVSDTARGKEIINVLIHLTDPSQNQHFSDKYFADVNFDLSKCLIVFTYNNPHTIDPILKDRMVTIHTKDYDMNDKVQIASKHLLPSILSQFGLETEKITIDDNVIRYIVNRIEKEAGVRNLKRALESIVSNINLSRLLDNSISDYITIDESLVDKYVKSCNQTAFPSSHMYM
jgi:ATP-dependent Lon protease